MHIFQQFNSLSLLDNDCHFKSQDMHRDNGCESHPLLMFTFVASFLQTIIHKLSPMFWYKEKLEAIGIIVIKSKVTLIIIIMQLKEARYSYMITYTCRYSSGRLIPLLQTEI